MGWTHDYRDLARDRSGRRGLLPGQRMWRLLPDRLGEGVEPGIPQLLGRRARWFGARLRHPRG
ncbi:hypothetical protein [Streptomyces marispadix]|uniref:Transposase n=1 Tax=Streptomyces marispadix TaxID=2922868 RepID=A0ABS9SZU1_9ACTN|nr:hypothetical protein [Streptomyces marispadix]MCH6161767.1 hypothetical protein [Streptomyces marispadix]